MAEDTNTSAPAETGLSEDKALDIFASMVADEAPRKPDKPKRPQGEAADTEADEDADEVEATADDDDGDEPDDTEAASDTDDTDDESSEKEPLTVTLKDGTKVTLDELERGYLRQADYTRKTQEVSRQRHETEQRLARLTQHETALQAQLQQAAAIVQRNMPKPPDPELEHLDPIAFLQQDRAYQKAVSELQNFGAQFQASQARLMAAERDRLEKVRAEQVSILFEKMPDLKDPKKRESFKAKTYDFAQKLGYTAQELDTVMDHRAYVTLDLARIGWEVVNGSIPNAKAKASNAPPVQKAGRRVTRAEGERQAMKSKMDKLRKTGRDADALAIFRSLV